MAINAKNNGTKRELIPAGNYVARCYQMLHIGTIEETIMGDTKLLNKVRIGWELPMEPLHDGKPVTIGKDYTLSMNEKANLRKMLQSWRGKAFTDKEAELFDVLNLLGVPCMLNIIHKTSAKGNEYEEIAGITPMPKGMECPAQIIPPCVFQYDQPDMSVLESLPDFIKDKIKGSQEYKALTGTQAPPAQQQQAAPATQAVVEDMPF